MPVLGFIVFLVALYLLVRFFRASFRWVKYPQELVDDQQIPVRHAFQIGSALFLGVIALILANPELFGLIFLGIPAAVIGTIIAYAVLKRRQNAAAFLLGSTNSQESGSS